MNMKCLNFLTDGYCVKMQLELFDFIRITLFFYSLWAMMKSSLAFIALSAAQSSAQTHIHSAIVVIDTSNNA